MQKELNKTKGPAVVDAKKIASRAFKLFKIALGLGIAGLAVILLMSMIRWFRFNTIVFKNPVEFKFLKPVQVKTLDQVKMEELQEIQKIKHEQDKIDWFNKMDEVLQKMQELENELESKAFVNVDKIAEVTAYTCDPNMTPEQKAVNCPNGVTASGQKPKAGVTIACDRANLGKTFNIQGYGERTCTDIGGMVKGAGRFDLFVDTLDEAINFGKQNLKYKLLNI